MFQLGVNLRHLSNYKIGGRADYFFAAKDVESLIAAVGEAREKKLPIFILGGGTNLLISDEGFRGLVLKPEIKKLKIDPPAGKTEKLSKEKVCVRVGAGVSVSEFLNFLISKGLAGMEWAGGLPGTVGGAIRGNAGAFGGEIKDSVVEVVSLDISGKKPRLIRRRNPECNFGYRNSIFKINNGREIIVEAAFRLKTENPKLIRRAVEEKIAYRYSRYPMEYPNIGSIFKNVDLKLAPKKLRPLVAHVVKSDPFPVIPVAYLIAEAGLKGVSCGGAMVSPRHTNFIVNTLGASSEDVRALIQFVKATVKKKFNLELEEEIVYV